MFLIAYILYLAILLVVSIILFWPVNNTLNEDFYGFIGLLEAYSLFFIRTRSSLKYFPIVTNALIYYFLYYVNYKAFGF